MTDMRATQADGDGSGDHFSADPSDLDRDESPNRSEVEAVDDEVLEGILGVLEPEDAEQVVQIVARAHRGPLPDPITLAQYSIASPDALKEIFEGAREHRQHSFRFENKLANTARLSLILVFVLVLAAFRAAYSLAETQPILASFFAAGGMGAVLLAMLRGGGKWEGR
jgi:uncharacterized membrane protein